MGYKFWSETLTALVLCVYMCGSRGRDRGSGLPQKNHKNVGFLSNTGPDPLKKHKAVKPAFNARPSSARQRNTIYRAFRWRANNGPFQCYLDPLSPYQKKEKKLDPLWHLRMVYQLRRLLTRLHRGACSSEPSLPPYIIDVIVTKILCYGPYYVH